MKQLKSVIGLKFENVTIVKDLGYDYLSNGRRYVEYQCDCGAIKVGEYQSIRRGRIVSCGCWKADKEYRQKQREAAYELQRNGKLNIGNERSDDDTPFRHYMKGIRQREIDTTLTCRDLKNQCERQHGRCAYTNVPLVLATHTDYLYPKYILASVDRVDSKKGYDVNNIQFVSLACNYAKNNMSHDEMNMFLDIVRHGIESLF